MHRSQDPALTSVAIRLHDVKRTLKERAGKQVLYSTSKLAQMVSGLVGNRLLDYCIAAFNLVISLALTAGPVVGRVFGVVSLTRQEPAKHIVGVLSAQNRSTGSE